MNTDFIIDGYGVMSGCNCNALLWTERRRSRYATLNQL